MQESKKVKVIEAESSMVNVRDLRGGRNGEILGKIYQIFSHKMSKFWESKAQHGDYETYCI